MVNIIISARKSPARALAPLEGMPIRLSPTWNAYSMSRGLQGQWTQNLGLAVCVCVNLASTALGLSHDWPVKAQGRAPSAAKRCC
jgi:hypothetical protein